MIVTPLQTINAILYQFKESYTVYYLTFKIFLKKTFGARIIWNLEYGGKFCISKQITLQEMNSIVT